MTRFTRFLLRCAKRLRHGKSKPAPAPASPPRHAAFCADPRATVGYESWAWLHWTDAQIVTLADAMVRAGVNTFALPLFACTRMADGVEKDEHGRTTYGYWTTFWQNEWFQAQVRNIMRVMWARRTVVSAGGASSNFTTGYGGITTCSLDDGWFHGVYNWLQAERVAAGMPPESFRWLPVNELGHPKTAGCYAKQLAWSEWSKAHAQGSLIGWNGDGGSPRSLPSGYGFAETHPQTRAARGPAGVPVIVLNDAPMRDLKLTLADGRINLADCIPYWQGLRREGIGVIVLDPRFAGGPDMELIRALAALKG